MEPSTSVSVSSDYISIGVKDACCLSVIPASATGGNMLCVIGTVAINSAVTV